MIIIYNHICGRIPVWNYYISSSQMIIMHDHHTWSSDMVIMYKDHVYVMIIYADHMWWSCSSISERPRQRTEPVCCSWWSTVFVELPDFILWGIPRLCSVSGKYYSKLHGKDRMEKKNNNTILFKIRNTCSQRRSRGNAGQGPKCRGASQRAHLHLPGVFENSNHAHYSKYVYMRLHASDYTCEYISAFLYQRLQQRKRNAESDENRQVISLHASD